MFYSPEIVIDADNCLTEAQREAVAESLDPRYICEIEPSSDGSVYFTVKHEDYADDPCRGQNYVREQLYRVLRALGVDRFLQDAGVRHSGGFASTRVALHS